MLGGGKVSCDFCKVKCNTCIHKGEEFDISDTWEDSGPIMVSYCNDDEDCNDYERDGNFSKMCGKKLNLNVRRNYG